MVKAETAWDMEVHMDYYLGLKGRRELKSIRAQE